jgi:hypothetical protein
MYITRSPNLVYIPLDVFNKIRTNTLIKIIFIGKENQQISLDLLKGVVVTDQIKSKPKMFPVSKRIGNGLIEQIIHGTLNQFKIGNLLIKPISELFKEPADEESKI